MTGSDARLEKLEIELVHQQRVTEQLNEVVTEQTKELMKLRRALELLTKQFVELRKRPQGNETPPTLEEEKPPHY